MFEKNEESRRIQKEDILRADQERKAKQEKQDSIFAKFEAFLDEHNDKAKAPKQNTELFTITPSGVQFDNEGYLYNAIWCGSNQDGTVISVEYFGITHYIILNAGINQVDIPHNSKIKSATANVTIAMIRSSHVQTQRVSNNDRAKEPFSGAATVTHSFTNYMSGFSIINNSTSVDPITFTINGDTYTVNIGESFDSNFALFNSVTVTIAGVSSFRAYGRI